MVTLAWSSLQEQAHIAHTHGSWNEEQCRLYELPFSSHENPIFYFSSVERNVFEAATRSEICNHTKPMHKNR
jgi:hypothetical protein